MTAGARDAFHATGLPLEPSQIRAAVPREAYTRETLRPLALFAGVSTLYVVTWISIFELPVWAMFPTALLNGLCMGVLFVIGHDACHGSFVPTRWLNATIGRIAFLPSLHPFSHWDLVHNQIHHGWTNLRNKDYVWAPFSKEEFDDLSTNRQRVERVGRTFFGVVIHYAVVIWWPRFAFPCAEDRAGVGQVGALERLTGAMFVLAQLVGGVELQARRGGTSPMRELALSAGLGVLVPFLLFTWLIGLVTFLHHNHEHVRWYDRREEWSFARGSLFGTVHVRPGILIDRILLNIMFHTAHHVDTRVPLYRLPRTQRALEEVYGNRIIQSRFSMRTALETFRDCKLYDYRKHVWLDFAGHPTTASVLEAAPNHSRPHQLSRHSAQAKD